MCDYPKFYTITNPRARKRHLCCECRGDIMPGDTYENFAGMWDRFGSFKTCPECVELRTDVSKRYREMPFRQMYECIFDSNEPDHVLWQRRYMAIRQKRNAPESPRRWMEIRLEEINQSQSTDLSAVVLP
jgi:hypothetical protein